jgi:hypothetical protein
MHMSRIDHSYIAFALLFAATQGHAAVTGIRQGEASSGGRAWPQPACTVSSPTPLAHGDMDAASVNNNVSNMEIWISCSVASNVTVRAFLSASDPTSTVPVRPNGTITSRLTVNGTDGATGVNLSIPGGGRWPTPSTKVIVTSTLATTAPTAGDLQGTALLVVNVPLIP